MTGPVLVTSVGAATGSYAAAAALTCAGSAPDRAGLLIDLRQDRSPRPSLIATAAARELEERLVAHRPAAAVTSRGHFCHLALSANESGIEQILAALPIVRESVAVIHLPQRLLQPLLDEIRIRPSGTMLRADLGIDRALTALAVRDLIERGIRVTVLKRPIGWLVARAALLGMLVGDGGLPTRSVKQLLEVGSPRGGGDASAGPSFGDGRRRALRARAVRRGPDRGPGWSGARSDSEFS